MLINTLEDRFYFLPEFSVFRGTLPCPVRGLAQGSDLTPQELAESYESQVVYILNQQGCNRPCFGSGSRLSCPDQSFLVYTICFANKW